MTTNTEPDGDESIKAIQHDRQRDTTMTNDNHDDDEAENSQTGTGKTTLPLSYLFGRSRGIFYFDPKGDDCNKMLELTDEERDEIIWVDDPEGENPDDP